MEIKIKRQQNTLGNIWHLYQSLDCHLEDLFDSVNRSQHVAQTSDLGRWLASFWSHLNFGLRAWLLRDLHKKNFYFLYAKYIQPGTINTIQLLRVSCYHVSTQLSCCKSKRATIQTKAHAWCYSLSLALFVLVRFQYRVITSERLIFSLVNLQIKSQDKAKFMPLSQQY